MARTILKGLSISPGVAIGPLIIRHDVHTVEKRHIDAAEIDHETDSLYQASQKVRSDLEKNLAEMPENFLEYKEIINIQIELAQDPRILEGAKARIRHRKICASWALAETIEELCSLFNSIPDPYLSDRVQDIKNMGASLAAALVGVSSARKSVPNGILASYVLSPADVLAVKLDGIQGLVTVEGGATSHSAILARGIKIPAIAGVTSLFEHARPGVTTIIDGLSGVIILEPHQNDLEKYEKRKKNFESFEKQARQAAHLPACTGDGFQITVYANLENPAEIASLKKSGYEGIGLYRTEFSFLGEDNPDEEKLLHEYKAAVDNVQCGPFIFRTLDVGADKLLPVQDALYEPNPALGLRGIRFCLQHRDFFSRQIRAILRSHPDGPVSVMLPMVTLVEEVQTARKIIMEVKNELEIQKLPHAREFSLGVMIETPAAVLICNELASICDFISIGTNDLLHYLMAIDRSNRHVAYLHNPLQPAFLRSIKMIVEAAREQQTPVSVCGELAADPIGIVLLLGLGIDRLSVAPGFVPAVKHIIRKLKKSSCENLVNEAINEFDTETTRQKLFQTLQDGLGSELSFHNTLSPVKPLYE